MPELLVILGVLVLTGFPVFIVASYKMFKKAGFPGALCLLMLVPIVNYLMLIYFGFAEWPVLKELDALRQRTR